MIIYEQEKTDGLSDQLSKGSSIAFQCLVQKDNTSFNDWEVSEVKKTIAGFIEDGRNFDLYHISSILASTGPNKNDDWFLAEEIIAARETPIYKQVNFGHNEKDIIGVITGSTLLDESGNSFEPGSERSLRDIVSHAVIWSYWEDDDLKGRFSQIVDDVENNRLFVSMESLFKTFDYLLIKDGQISIIKRSKETSFLTKYLKIYGGVGEYNGSRIYRLLRNFTFSGMALVDNPANARSIISDNLMNINDENKSIASCGCECECCDDDSVEDILDSEDSFDDGEDDYSVFSSLAEESKKENKRLNKPFRTPDGPKKFSVYVKNDKGNVVKVNFGDPNMSIKRDNPERRKSFRARHNCDNSGPKWKARYWSCKFWSNPSVTKLLAENVMDPNEIVMNTLKAELAQSKAELEIFKQAEAEKTSAEIAELKASNEILEKQIAELTILAQAAKDEVKEAEAKFELFTKEKDKEKEDAKAEKYKYMDEAKAQIAALQTEKVTAARLNKLMAVNLEAAKAEDIMKTWASVSDDHFDKLVEIYAVTPVKTKSEVTDGFDLDSTKATASVVNPNGDPTLQKAVAEEKALAEKIAAQFNFKKSKGSK